MERVRNESTDPQVPWQQLAGLEKTFSSDSFKSLLSSLAVASAEGYTGPKPKVCLSKKILLLIWFSIFLVPFYWWSSGRKQAPDRRERRTIGHRVKAGN